MIIGATAEVHRLTFVTRKVKHFEGMKIPIKTYWLFLMLKNVKEKGRIKFKL